MILDCSIFQYSYIFLLSKNKKATIKTYLSLKNIVFFSFYVCNQNHFANLEV
nr:MAG TPA: hypothetical protein [Caudoviricetes sp.]